jgi:formyl-CoA transferase
MVVEVTHPTHGVLPTLGTPIKFDPPEPFAPLPPARLGEHTDTVLREVLRYSAERLGALRRAGAIR